MYRFDVTAGDPKGRGTAPDFPAEYVWHCHILEHEQNDMMRPLQVHEVPRAITVAITLGRISAPNVFIIAIASTVCHLVTIGPRSRGLPALGRTHHSMLR